MQDPTALDDLIAQFDPTAFQRALAEAYRRGVAAGEIAARDKVLAVLAPSASRPTGATIPSVPEGLSHPSPGRSEDRDIDEENAKRAPRGLTREVITLVLGDEPGLEINDLQAKVVAFDERVSPKTVYNEVNREKGRLYRERFGKWFLIKESDVEAQPPSIGSPRPSVIEWEVPDTR